MGGQCDGPPRIEIRGDSAILLPGRRPEILRGSKITALKNDLSLSTFDYLLDPALIAANPTAERDASRLLVYHRERRKVEHRSFTSLPEYLSPSDLLVFNDTRVIPARLYAKRKTGGRLELLLLRTLSAPEEAEGRLIQSWEALVKGRASAPLDLVFSGGATGRIVGEREGGRKELLLSLPSNHYRDFYAFL
ncbi:MAG TPA: S-adenosylmethionine:tRNA ribosyltransferase-isomerase, partial [Candidatus Manganitrophaceae bacterium]|nr:S-adenosylmethionine:tRNA ribosyltransferase-isomerase [Candidatus Manganitrophaceae bacterium]